MLPFTSLFTAYSSEVVFPLPEGSATGYLFAASQTFGFLLGIGSIAVVDSAAKESSWQAYLIMAIHFLFLILSFVFTFLTKETLNRSNYELKQKKNNESFDNVENGYANDAPFIFSHTSN